MPLRIKRLLAGLIDFYIIFATTAIIVETTTIIIGFATLGKADATPFEFAVFVITSVLIVIFQDLIFGNASIGKRIFKIHIEADEKGRALVLTLLKRNVPKLLVPLELILLLSSNERLGDMWSQTTIVNDE